MAFIDIEKVYDRVPKEVLWSYSEKKGVPLDILEIFYKKAKTRVRSLGGDTKDFYIDIGLHQGL